MKTLIGLLVVAGLALGLGWAAGTRTIRHPPSGSPFFTIDVPDSWIQHVDGHSNLIILDSQPAKVGFSILLSADSSDLDALAAASLKAANAAAPTRTEDVTLSGFNGRAWTSKMEMGSAMIGLRLVIVRVDATHTCLVMRMSFPGASDADLDAADAVASSMKISR